MFKSIFQRLLFTYAAIIISVVILLAALLTYFLNIYLYEQKQNQLFAAGHRAQELARDHYAKNIGRDELLQTVNTLGYITDSRIYVLLGKKLAGLKSLDEQLQEGTRESQVADDLKKILDGETMTRKKQFSNQLNTYVVFVGIPVFDDDTVIGAVLLYSPLDQVNKALLEVNKIIWGAAAASLALAAVVIFILSRRISRPIESMQIAAAAVAEGDFSVSVEPDGRDEIAQLAATFNYMKNRLKQIEEMRKDLIANVSHELRTPLTSIRGFIQGILEGVIGPGEQEKYLSRVFEETSRLNRLVNDLLQLARLQAGSVKLNREIVDVGALVSDLTEELGLYAKQRGTGLGAEIAGGKLTVPADRDRLKQIILNLLHNAVSYSGEGGEVLIRVLKENGKVVIKVADNGAGIPEEELEFIFKKFHRVEKPGVEPGSGLGLTIAKELVELHGGIISVRSIVDQGTEFTVTLPGCSEPPLS